MKRQTMLLGLAIIPMLTALPTQTQAAPNIQRTVSIKVVEAKVGRYNGNFDPGSLRPGSLAITPLAAPDFYVVPKIDGKQLKKSKTRSDRTSPRFNHTVARRVSSTKQRIPLSLKLMDNDPWPNKDDTADINPSSSSRILTLSYNPTNGRVYGPGGKVLGRRGQTITLSGDHRKYKASISFVVKHSDREVSPQPPFDPNCRKRLPNCQPK